MYLAFGGLRLSLDGVKLAPPLHPLAAIVSWPALAGTALAPGMTITQAEPSTHDARGEQTSHLVFIALFRRRSCDMVRAGRPKT